MIPPDSNKNYFLIFTCIEEIFKEFAHGEYSLIRTVSSDFSCLLRNTDLPKTIYVAREKGVSKKFSPENSVISPAPAQEF